MNWKLTGATRPLAASLAVLFAAACSDPEPVGPSAEGLIPLFSHWAPEACDATVTNGESIQAAIDAASAGETICVEEGTFPGNLSLNKDGLTLLGAHSGIPAGPEAEPVGRGTDESVIEGRLESAGVTGLTVDGFTIESPESERGIQNLRGSGHTIANNIFQGTGFAGEGSFHVAIMVGNDDAHVFENNNFQGYVRGILLDGGPANDPVEVRGNYFGDLIQGVGTFGGPTGTASGHVFTDNVFEDLSLEGLFLANGGNVVSQNTFTGAVGSAIRIFIVDVRSYGSVITDNTIENNGRGITVQDGTDDAVPFEETVASAHGNSITGNVEWGIRSLVGDLFVATCNWWGAADGPGGDGTGSGDAVDGDGDVEFTPWSETADAEDPCEGGLEPDDPEEIEMCMDGGWEDFGFQNQGLCIQFVNTGRDSR